MRVKSTVASVALAAGAFGLGVALTHVPLGFAGKRQPMAQPASPSSAATATVEPGAIQVPAATVAAAVPTASFAPLVDAVKPAVVAIEVETKMTNAGNLQLDGVPEPFRRFFGEIPEHNGQKVHGEGSGFIVSEDGYVLTNNHVVENATDIVARFADGREVAAKVIGTDPATDVALLKLAGDEAWPHVELASSHDLRVGDWVVAVGNPLGLGITVTAGIVSATGRVLGHDAFDDFIQTDAAINQGNSGGPLFDTQGRVVGMNTAIIQGANTVGFAVPADLISEVVGDLQSDGKVSRGYLGVELQAMDVTLAKALGAPEAKGALVASVQPGTPAAGAGLAEGDIITRIGAKDVADSQALIREVARHDPGEKIDVGVLRNGKPKTFALTLGQRPGNDALAAADDGGESSDGADLSAKRLGVGLEPLPPNAQRALGTATGVLVDDVDQDGPSYGKLRRGDVIQEIDGAPVTSPDDVKSGMRKAGDTVVLKIVRQGSPLLVAIAP